MRAIIMDIAIILIPLIMGVMAMVMVIRLLGYMEVMAIEAGMVTMADIEVVMAIEAGMVTMADIEVVMAGAIMAAGMVAFAVVVDET
jgi:hypothetical protein